MMIQRPKPVEKELFSPNFPPTQARYGLPLEVRYCEMCVISNQRPNSTVEFRNGPDSLKETIAFDSDGVCDACRFAEKKKSQIDWSERRDELEKLCDANRSTTGAYDCIVPGSGGKDSVLASNMLKKEFGMHPLTVTWAPHSYTDWGWKNFQSWIHSGQDNVLFTPNGQVHRLLTRLAVDNLLHPFQPFMLGQKLLAPKMAARFGIPLVFFGENEAEYGNPISDTTSATRKSTYFAATDYMDLRLGGTKVSSLLDDFGLEMADLAPYLPTSEDEIGEAGIEVHYLGYYIKWHPQSAYYYAVESSGFQPSPERTPGTYSKYNSIDDKIDDLHYLTTGIKFGIGRASYDASQEIRSGDITRDEGVMLVKKFDHEFPERFLPEMLDYLSVDNRMSKAAAAFESPVMDRTYFTQLLDSFRSPHIWQLDKDDSWELRVPLK